VTSTGAAPVSSVGGAELTSGRRRRILTFATLGTLFDGADFAIFLIFLVPLARHFEVSVLTVSAIHATSYIAGIAGGMIFGVLADRRGRKPALTAAVAMFSIFTLATAFAPDLGWLLVLRVLAGIGIGGESGVAFALINEAYPGSTSKRGARSGFVQTIFIFGNFLAFGIFQLTSHLYGDDAWRWAFAYLGLAGVLAFFVRFWMPESPQWLRLRAAGAEPARGRISPFRELASPPLRRSVMLAIVLMTTAFFGAYAVISYAPSMWQQSFGLPAGVVAQLGYAGSVAAILGYLLNGYLPDLIGHRHDLTCARAAGMLGALYWSASQLDLPALADSGYDDAGQAVHTPIKQPGNGQVLAPDNQTYNTLLRSVRSRGERGFALLTGRWRALRRVTASPRRIGDYVKVALVLTHIEQLQLRASR
jgi:MFS family permease